MKRSFVLLLLVAACASDDGAPAEPEIEPALPAPEADRVGLPANYATSFKPFYVFDRPDTRQVRVVYANDTASLGTPFRHGSVLVMETYRARTDAQNALVLD